MNSYRRGSINSINANKETSKQGSKESELSKGYETASDRLYKLRGSIWTFADQVGYKYSPYRSDFISEFSDHYEFLFKFAKYDRSSGFWRYNGENLSENDQKIRDKLNEEISIRRSAKPLEKLKRANTVSSIGKYLFCPVSFAINISYDVIKSETLLKSYELRKGFLFDGFVDSLLKNRTIDYILEKMNLTRQAIREPEFYVNWYKGEIRFSYENYKQKTIRQTIKFNPDELRAKLELDWELRKVLQSKIIYRRVTKTESSEKYFYNREYDIAGNPDYILESKDNKDLVVLLEKHTWQKEPVNAAYFNHIMQAVAYLHLFKEEINASYAYLAYLQSIKQYRVFKITLHEKLIGRLLETIESINQFCQKGFHSFDPNSISVKKCFGCSVRMYCFHKAGRNKRIELPYLLKNSLNKCK